jgi:hypothetical protein
MMNDEKYIRGSEWRKWDLHIHSRETKLNNQFGTVSDSDFAVKTQIESRGVTVFLNLELRLTYQNKENDCCDIHILYS